MAGGNLGKATATLDLYNTPFMKALNASGAAFVRTASGMAKVGGLATAAGAAIVTPVIAAAKSFAAYGDNLDKMSGRNGIGVEALQELGFAAEQSGASLDNVSKAAKKMQESTVNAVKGSQEAQVAFKQLGISLDEFQKLSTEEQFKLVGDRIGKIQDPALRTSTAMKLLGRDGVQLMNLFATGADGMEDYAKQARQLGLVFSEADTKDAANMTDAVNEMGRAVKAIWMSIGGAVAPVITDIAREAGKIVGTVSLWSRDNKQLIVSIFKIAAIVAGVGTALVAVGGAMAAIVTIGGAIVGAITAVIGTVVSLMTSLAAIPIAVVAIGAVVAYQFGVFDSIVSSLKETWSAAWGGIVAAVMKGDLQTAFDIAWVAIQITYTKGFNVLKMGWRGTVNFVRDVWDTVVNELAKGIVSTVTQFQFLGKVVAIVFKAVLDNAKKIGNALLHPIETAKKVMSGQGLGLEMHISDEIKAASAKARNDLVGSVNVLDEDLARKRKAREDASKAAYDADNAKIDGLNYRMNELIAKANEPLITPENEKKVKEQTAALQAAANLSNMTSGVGSFSSRALRSGQSLGDKTIKEIKGGIDQIVALATKQNEFLEDQVGPG